VKALRSTPVPGGAVESTNSAFRRTRHGGQPGVNVFKLRRHPCLDLRQRRGLSRGRSPRPHGASTNTRQQRARDDLGFVILRFRQDGAWESQLARPTPVLMSGHAQ
jgi:hypothetical protein